MNLQIIRNEIYDYHQILPDLLTLAYDVEKTNEIKPCSNCLCWCNCITIEQLSYGKYAFLWYNTKNSYTTKTVRMKIGQ